MPINIASTLALLDGRVDPATFTNERRNRPDVDALLARFELVPDPTIIGKFDEMHVEITVTLANGKVVESAGAC